MGKTMRSFSQRRVLCAGITICTSATAFSMSNLSTKRMGQNCLPGLPGKRNCLKPSSKRSDMKPVKTTVWEPSEYLETEEQTAAYLEDIFKSGNPSFETVMNVLSSLGFGLRRCPEYSFRRLAIVDKSCLIRRVSPFCDIFSPLALFFKI